MTLCVSWIRDVNNEKELIFATDSCLSGGERWNSGVKLFELPRKDCLICFAGETNRTYPLILNLISTIKFDEYLLSSHTDIAEVLDYLTRLFTSLCHSIKDYGTQDFKAVLGDFQFLFGGWSWKDNNFRLWKLEYNHSAGAFMHDEVDDGTMFYTFIGDELEKSVESLNNELISNKKITAKNFDMEPFKVLVEMIREKTYSTIGGTVQIAKIHPPGITEFLGVYWPSVSGGKKTFLSKDVGLDNDPLVKYIDPDTGTIVDEALPETLSSIDESTYGDDMEFMNKCYPDGKLKEDLSKRDKHLVKSVISKVAFTQFIDRQQEEILEEQ